VIGIDTNILLRYLVADDPGQAALAIDLFEHRLNAAEPGFIALAVVVETAWVLERRYGRTAGAIRAIIAQLLDAPQVVVERPDVVEAALALAHPDFADAVIHASGKAAGCTATLTFDRGFARLPEVELLGGGGRA